MASQPTSLPDAPATPSDNDDTTGSETQALIRQDDKDQGPLEAGEISALEVKQEEEREHVSTRASNPFLRYNLNHLVSNEHGDQNASPFARVGVATVTAKPANPFGQPERVTPTIPPPTTAIQRRNHARLSDMVVRLQNFDGTLPELLAIASVQQQLDAAFADLDHAKNQLKDVLKQFELQGHISNRQYHKKNGATRDLTKASQRITQLTKELWDLQRRESNAC